LEDAGHRPGKGRDVPDRDRVAGDADVGGPAVVDRPTSARTTARCRAAAAVGGASTGRAAPAGGITAGAGTGIGARCERRALSAGVGAGEGGDLRFVDAGAAGGDQYGERDEENRPKRT